MTKSPTIIAARTRWQIIDWSELREFRDLFYFFVWRDIKVLYKQTVLGFSWAVIRPLFSMVVFSVVFGGLAKVPSDGVPYPIFSYTALVPWTYFATSMTRSTSSLLGNADMMTKVYFPRLIIPMAPILAGLVDFVIASVILGGMMVWYGIIPGMGLLVLPVLVALMVLTAAGIGLWLSALAIQYRDVKYAAEFLAQLLLYAAPVVWPVSLLTENYPDWGDKVRLFYGLYPMAGVIEGFRAALLQTTPIPWDLIGMGALSAVALAVFGALYFTRIERNFADAPLRRHLIHLVRPS